MPATGTNVRALGHPLIIRQVYPSINARPARSLVALEFNLESLQLCASVCAPTYARMYRETVRKCRRAPGSTRIIRIYYKLDRWHVAARYRYQLCEFISCTSLILINVSQRDRYRQIAEIHWVVVVAALTRFIQKYRMVVRVSNVIIYNLFEINILTMLITRCGGSTGRDWR